MKSQVRSHVAAVMLLAPVAATMVAGPAFAQRAVVAPAAVIQQFDARPSDRLQPGSEVRFRLVGAPNGRAFVNIPGVVRRVELDEVRPGLYEGSYTVRPRDSLDSFSEAVATLRTGDGVRATARADLRNVDREYGRGYGWGRDNRGPEISNVSPADNSRVVERERTTISARLSDDGRGVDPNSVTLRVDGRDVTRNARISGDQIHYRDDLGRGRHTAELTVRDRAGNTARHAWSFEVVDPRERAAGRRDAPAPEVAASVQAAGPLPLQLTNMGNGTHVDLRHQPLVVQGRTLPHADVQVEADAMVFSMADGLVPRSMGTRNIRADGNGFFSVVIDAPRNLTLPVTNYDVRVRANSGSLQAEHSVRLRQGS